jgi:hypothetical protein
MTKFLISILALLFLGRTSLFGQHNSETQQIYSYAYMVDTSAGKVDTASFIMDSIEVSAQIQKNRIVATCLFRQSKSKLVVSLYLKKKALVFVKIQEESPKMNDLSMNTLFYYKKAKLFHADYNHTVRPCMLISWNQSVYETYGYNPSLNADFLKVFVLLLYNELKR